MQGSNDNKTDIVTQAELQARLDYYAETYDSINTFLDTEPEAKYRAMAIAHRKHVLNQMLCLRMAIRERSAA